MGQNPRRICWVVLVSLLLPATASADFLGRVTAPFEAALIGGNIALSLGLVFLAGIATAFTPCVYPMIAITVSVFGARQTSSRMDAAALSTMFVLGIAALFTPLGIVSAATGTAFGGYLASKGVLIGLAIVFIAMALSMFGFFDFALASSIQNRLARVGGSGYRGAFALGMVSGLIAAPCTGPVIAVLLAWTATTGNVVVGAAALFVYALGLGVLFWIVGTFAIALPKSGAWVEWTKSIFGIAMLVLALYYLRGVLPLPALDVRNATWLWTSVALAVAGIVLGAIHLSFRGGSALAKVRKLSGVLLLIAGSFGGVQWASAVSPGEHIQWMADFKEAKQLARVENKPLMIDFGADWCGACNELEKGPLSNSMVVAEAQRFVTARVDLSADAATEEKWALLSSYKQQGLPFIVLHHADGTESVRITGMLGADELLELMKATRGMVE